MLATVTNVAAGPRGFSTLDRGLVVLEGGDSAVLDLADHPSHAAWRTRGEVRIVPLSDKEARAARRRLESEAEALCAGRAAALAALPPAAPAGGDNASAER